MNDILLTWLFINKKNYFRRGAVMFAIIYHNNCSDGFMSAYLMAKYLDIITEITGSEYKLYPMNYGDPLPDIEYSYVFVLDFSFDEVDLDILAHKNIFVELLDHHESAFRKLSQLHQNNEPITVDEKVTITRGFKYSITLDNNHSGCGMVYEYITNPSNHIFNAYPKLLDYKGYVAELARLNIINNKRLKLVCDAIEDRDLWRFNLPDTEEIQLMMSSVPKNTRAYDQFLYANTNAEFNYELTKARNNVEYMNSLAGSAASKAKLVKFQGIEIPCTNCTSLISLTNDKMKGDYGISMTYFITNESEVIVSLRADKTKGYNVAELASIYGGGGHQGAAGFKLPIEKLEALLQGKL